MPETLVAVVLSTLAFVVSKGVIPLARPEVGPEASEMVAEVLASGRLVQGPRVEAFEQALERVTGCAHAVAVSSGTAALYLAYRALGVASGHVVSCPALSWPSPAHAARLVGAGVELVDVDLQSWNAGPEQFLQAQGLRRGSETAAEKRSELSVAIDQFGSPADVSGIKEVTGQPVLLDAACSIGSEEGGAVGRRGSAVTCLSFHPRKIVTTGEGGACLTNDAAMADELRTLRNHGQRSAGVFETPGHNFRLTEIAAVLGTLQLERLGEIVAARSAIATRYRDGFPATLATQKIRPGCVWNVQTFGVLVGKEERAKWIHRLGELGVQAGILSYALSQIGSLSASAPCPNAEAIAAAGMALPVFAGMSDNQVSKVIDAVNQCANEFGAGETHG